jgi:tetratricopeptide (TPR) repeat protein
MIKVKFLYDRISSWRALSNSLFIIILLCSLFLIQCKTTDIIYENIHFSQLKDVEKIEYKYSLNEGIKYRLLGDYPRAIYFLNRAAEIFPSSDVSHYELSNIYLRSEEPKEAVLHGTKAIEIQPDNIWYYYNIAEIKRNFPEFDSLNRILERGVEIFPDNFRLHYELAQLYQAEKNYEACIRILQKIEEFAGINERTSLLKHHVYMEKGEFEKGHMELLALVKKFPDEPRYYGLLAEFFATIDMKDEAIASYKKLFEMDPDNGTAQLSVADFYIMNQSFDDAFYYLVTAFNNYGISFEEKVQFYAAITSDAYLVNNYTERIEQLGNLLIENYPEEGIIKLILSDVYIRQNEYSKSLILLKDLYQKDTGNEKVAEQLVTILGYSGDYTSLLEYGLGIHERFPDNTIVMYFLGIAHQFLGSINESADILEKAVDTGIDNILIKAQVFLFLGENYYRLQNFDKSDEYFESSIELDPDNYISRNNYAYYLALRGENLKKALKYSELTLKYEPENASFLDTYAWILYKMGRIDEAYEYIKLAYEADDSNSYDIVIHYAKILIGLKRYDESLDFLEKARKLTDDYSELDELFLFIENADK